MGFDVGAMLAYPLCPIQKHVEIIKQWLYMIACDLLPNEHPCLQRHFYRSLKATTRACSQPPCHFKVAMEKVYVSKLLLTLGWRPSLVGQRPRYSVGGHR